MRLLPKSNGSTDAAIATAEAEAEPGDDDAAADPDARMEAEAEAEAGDSATCADADADINIDADIDIDIDIEADQAETDVEDERPETESDDVDGPSMAEAEAAPDGQRGVSDRPPRMRPEPAAAAPVWTWRQLGAVGVRVVAVLVVVGLIGAGLGAAVGGGHVARAEFVYTLDESIPDGFLREDRRLLTQVVAFESDAVLTPVAEANGLTVAELRSRVDVEILELSEILRLDVRHPDPDQALALNRAIVDEYLQVTLAAAPAGSGQELEQRRADIIDRLAAARTTLAQRQERDLALELRQDAIERSLDQRYDRIDRLEASIDAAIVDGASAGTRAALSAELVETREEVGELEAELVELRTERLQLASSGLEDGSADAEVTRLAAMLATIDEELAQRELGPLVASPLRSLGPEVVLERSLAVAALQGAAIGLLAGIPVAAIVGHRIRSRQRWHG